jgi:protein-tyrosine phosphatase
MKKIKVLFVCLGNICRSPLAEAVFKHKIKEKGIEGQFEADSCGTANYHIDDTPDPRTMANARKNGVTIEHLGRQLSTRDLEYFDHVFAMDNANLRNIQKLPNAKQHSEKIRLMRDYDPVGTGSEVPDPYYGQETHFQEVFEILDRSTEALIESLTQTNSSS